MILAGLIVGVMASSQTLVLTYHDIIPSRNKDSVWFDCTIDEFKSQISWMVQKGAVFVSTKDVYLSLLTKKPLPKSAVCITFADNYLGFYKYAWSILRAKKIPVTQFVHTGFVGSTIGRPKMTWKQLIELDRTGLVTIGSQTVSHPADLTKMSSRDVLSEFTVSKRELERKLGHPVLQLAYPNGKFNSIVSTLAKRAGYMAAFTEECRPAEMAPSEFLIPRYVHTKLREGWNSKSNKLKNPSRP